MPEQKAVQYKQRLNNDADGVGLNSAVYPLPWVYQWCGYDSLKAIRKANNFRPKIYAVPDQSLFPIRVDPPVTNADNPGMLPSSTYVTQVRMVPGTLILGMSLTNIIFETPGSYNADAFSGPTIFYVSCVDDATGIPFFTEWAVELMFNVPTLWQDNTFPATITDRAVYVAKSAWLPLTKPRPVLDPGVVSVMMCAKGPLPPTGVNTAPQLILQCAEPCGASVSPQGACA